VLVHALNPWGFAHLRRVNESNVDLNRNFLPAGARYAGMPRLYPALDALLNPRSPPRRDAFALRAAWHALRSGVGACRQAIAEGQYEYPQGLFYGGPDLEEGPARFLHWLRAAVSRAQRLLVFDLHTGLGRFGAQTLLAEPQMPAARVAHWAQVLHARIEGGAGATDPGGFSARGSLAGAIREAAAHARPEFFTVEYGTCSGLTLLHALREENRWHHYGDGTLAHPAKARLEAVFAPASERWRADVVRSGDALLRAAVRALAAADA
jgi:predicted deacylase